MIGSLRTRVLKQPIIVLYFEFETVLKFYNLRARLPNIRVDQKRSLGITNSWPQKEVNGYMYIIKHMIRMILVCTFSQIKNDIIFIFTESADTDHPNHLLDDIFNLGAYLKK